MAAEIGPTAPNRFSVDQALIDEIRGALREQQAARDALREAEAAYRAAVSAHDASREALASSVSKIANVVYAAPGTTPEMIVSVGLLPRAKTRTRAKARTVVRLFATPRSDGSVDLEFDRSGNGESVSYIVESHVGSGPWSFVASIQRTGLRLPGPGTGQERGFRVTASVNGVCAKPSDVATIFPAEDARRVA